MSDGIRLASGYVELTVRTAGKAMEAINAEITGVEKVADKAGKQAGDSLDKWISQGAKSAGKSIEDAITSSAESAEKAGEIAGEAISKGVTKGAKDAGKAIQDEIGSATKKAADEAAKTKVQPKVDTKPARDAIIKDIGGAIIQAARDGAKDAGYDLDQELTKAAGRAGKRVGSAIHDAIADTPVGDALGAIRDTVQGATDGVRKMSDAITGLKSGDVGGALHNVSGALDSIGQSGAASALDQIGTEADKYRDTYKSLKTDIKDTADVLTGLSAAAPGIAGGLGTIGTALSAVAGPLAVIAGLDLAAIKGVIALGDVVNPPSIRKPGNYNEHGYNPGEGIVPQNAHGTPEDLGGLLGAPPPPAPPAAGPQPAGQVMGPFIGGSGGVPDNLLPPSLLPKRAKGGVTPAGQIYGPGTGTSDSVIGVGADGMPTARVSTGEGVVTKSAMDGGWAQIVAAANGGMKLPGYDEGTTNVGGQPAPVDPMMQRYLAAMQRGFNPSAPLGAGPGEGGLQNNSIRTRRLIQQLFPEITDVGGYRPPDGFNEHSSGQALDFMIPGWNTPQGKMVGDQLSNFLMQNSGSLGLDYTIWQHGQHNPDGSFQQYADRGSPTQNHQDHVHSHSIASGFPGKDQQFMVPPQLQALFAGGGGGAGGGGAPNLGAAIAGVPADPAGMPATGGPGGKEQRTQGYIPAGAGGGGQTGTSFASGALQMGAQAINGLIDQAASAASTAAGIAAGAGSFGAGGSAGSAAASFAIGIGADAAKRGVKYGFQMAGIGIDSAAEILSPFGVPRFFQTDPTQFMPQLPGQAAATTTGEKAKDQQNGVPTPDGQPGGPVQPGQMPGQQPVAASVPIATPGTGDFTPGPAGTPGLSGPAAPAPAAPAVPGPTPAGPPAVAPQPQPQAAPLPAMAPTAPQPPHQPTTSLNWLAPPDVFDDGGWLMPNALALNRSGRPEPILNGPQMDNLQAIASQGSPTPDPKAFGGGGNDYSVRIENVTVKDVEEMQREIDSRQRLQRFRYGGRP
jgi:hypothetical protein